MDTKWIQNESKSMFWRNHIQNEYKMTIKRIQFAYKMDTKRK